MPGPVVIHGSYVKPLILSEYIVGRCHAIENQAAMVSASTRQEGVAVRIISFRYDNPVGGNRHPGFYPRFNGVIIG